MTIDWDDYEPFQPGVWGPLHDVARKDAREAFHKLIREKSARIEALRQLLCANCVDLSEDDAGIQRLNDWFAKHVEPDAKQPGRLRPLWYAVVNDIALFLGDVVIGRCPGLRWEFFTWGRKDAAYQLHVIMGFARVANPKYYFDFDGAVATYGHRIIEGLGVEKDAFCSWVRIAAERA